MSIGLIFVLLSKSCVLLSLLFPGLLLFGLGFWAFSDLDNGADDNDDGEGTGNPPDPEVDPFLGTAGNDTLVGDDESNFIRADSGDDVVEFSDGNDTISAGSGNDTVEGFVAGEIYGGSGADVLSGYESAMFWGGAGNDTIGVSFGATAYGGVGEDLINLGPDGHATLGAGQDQVVLSASGTFTDDIWNAGPATVSDYTSGQDTYSIFSGRNGEVDGRPPVLTFENVGSDVLVTIYGTSILMLTDTQVADLHANDFTLDGSVLTAGENSNLGASLGT